MAAGDSGIQFISSLAQYTGADLAASLDTSGPTSLGGNWDLEYISGSIETALIQSSETGSTLDVPWLTQQDQTVSHPEVFIQVGAFFTILSYGDNSMQIGHLPSGQSYSNYDGLIDAGFDDDYEAYLSATTQLGTQWTLLSDDSGNTNWQTEWSLSLASWDDDANHHATFTEGGLYHAYIHTPWYEVNADQVSLGSEYNQKVSDWNQMSLAFPLSEGVELGDSNAIVALNEEDGTLVLALRGTDLLDASFASGQAWSGDGLYLHYEAFRPLIDAVYSYCADASNGIEHIVVSGHSLGGAMADLFTIVDGRRFAQLSGSDLTIVSLASPGIDPDVITDNATDFGFSAQYDQGLVSVSGGTITLADTSSFSEFYHGFSHDRDRVYFAELTEEYLQQSSDPSLLEFTPKGADGIGVNGNTNFGADIFNLANIRNEDVSYHPHALTFLHGFGADHNGLIYWQNINALMSSPLYAYYSDEKLIFGVGDYAADPLGSTGWFTRETADDLNTLALLGSATDEFLLGLDGNDQIVGYDGRDLLDGGPGDDHLRGGGDQDAIHGGQDNDLLVGGPGHDIFLNPCSLSPLIGIRC